VNNPGNNIININSNVINAKERNEETDKKNNLENIDKNKDQFDEDLNLFGSYEIKEISDIIEENFIMERFYSPYSLIKFSLLNIIAITRGFENKRLSNLKVIETICNFCVITKTLARKYMNIFLNIFQSLHDNHILKNKKEFFKCMHIIKQYFEKSKSIPNEETAKALNYFNENQNEFENINKVDDNISEEKSMFKFINDNGKFFDEKNKKDKFDKIMKIIESTFSENYFNKTEINTITYKELSTSYSKHGIKDKDNFLPKTPINLYCSSNELLKEYINNNFKNIKDYYEEIIYDTLSLLFYFKIPSVGEKWIENYDKKQEIKGLKNSLLTIIAILVNLIDVIQDDFKIKII